MINSRISTAVRRTTWRAGNSSAYPGEVAFRFADQDMRQQCLHAKGAAGGPAAPWTDWPWRGRWMPRPRGFAQRMPALAAHPRMTGDGREARPLGDPLPAGATDAGNAT